MSIKNVTLHPMQKVLLGNCLQILPNLAETFDVTFLDPPFNQQKDYNFCDDDLPENDYWQMISDVAKKIFEKTSEGGAIYFMQREKILLK